MDGKKVEVECPVCDQRIPAEAKRCPNCGADFTVSGIDELEQVAHDLKEPTTTQGAANGPSKENKVDDEKKDGLLGRFFKKKR